MSCMIGLRPSRLHFVQIAKRSRHPLRRQGKLWRVDSARTYVGQAHLARESRDQQRYHVRHEFIGDARVKQFVSDHRH